MSKRPPDQILDVRVRVPYGVDVDQLVANCRERIAGIEGIYPAIDRDPGAPLNEKPEAPDVTLTDLQQIHNRLNRQAERVEKLMAEITSARVNMGAGLGQNDERIDNLEKHCEAMQSKIETLEQRVDYHGIKLPEPKRTVKGGWANVYSGGMLAFHSTRAGADKECSRDRIACIQIPDITEGDGL